jgi:hypothetical protein
MTAADATAFLNTFAANLKGLVPSPGTPSGTKFLRDDGTWVTITPTTDASALTTGTLVDARLSANVPLLGATENVFTGKGTFDSLNTHIITDAAGGAPPATIQFDTGILYFFDSAGNQLRFENGQFIANTGVQFVGDGTGLTNLPAANVTGTLDDARLSANVPLMTAGVLPAVDGSLLINLPAPNLGAFAGDILPDADATRSLGSNGFGWATGAFSQLYVDSIVNNHGVGSANINVNANDLYLNSGNGGSIFCQAQAGGIAYLDGVSSGQVIIGDNSIYTRVQQYNGDVYIGNSSGMLSFFGVAAAPVQVAGSLTNNVTAGGSDGVIANFTDLAVYANSAAAIRNNIYQLAKQVKEITDALGAYGLLN